MWAMSGKRRGRTPGPKPIGMKAAKIIPARQKFKIGQRVRVSPEGLRRDISPMSRTGMIDHFGYRSATINVLRDGMTTTARYHMDYWEVDPAYPLLK